MPDKGSANWQAKLHDVIYESNTPAGKAFDVGLLILIISSIAVVMLDSITEWHGRYGDTFYVLEWVFTLLFTAEYTLRLICIRHPMRYATSFLGIIDFLSIMPTYLSLFYAGTQALLVVRSLRLMRIFRIFKLTHFVSEMHFLSTAIRASLKKIAIFMLIVVTLMIITGSVMYLIESGENGFTSIPTSIYWAIVTTTTVGYGDISPTTPLGKFFASLMMLMGYGIIAVPTGILTSEMAMAFRNKANSIEVCPGCGMEGHDGDAIHCKRCGSLLVEERRKRKSTKFSPDNNPPEQS
jgi:voltage-gated potassium channel